MKTSHFDLLVHEWENFFHTHKKTRFTLTPSKNSKKTLFLVSFGDECFMRWKFHQFRQLRREKCENLISTTVLIFLKDCLC